MAERYLKESAVIFDGSWAFDSNASLTPASITGATNNYDPTGWRDSGVIQVAGIRMSTDGGNYSLTGLAAPTDGKTYLCFISNVGASGNITLQANDANSDAANRFLFSSNVQLQADEGIWIYYDQTDARWREIARAT